MRASGLAVALAAALLLVPPLVGLPLVAPPLVAQEPPADPHGAKSVVTLRDLEVAERRRVRDLWSEVVCACPRENWSKTLANCPDGCSDPQKQEVLRGVAAGWTDQAILADQRARHGPKALASPEGRAAYVLPFLVLLAAAGVVVYVCVRWRRPAESVALGASAGDAEIDAVERELEELT